MCNSYKGSCHCKFIQFEVTAEIAHVRQCNCSVCLKRGALNFRVNNDALKLLTPLDELSLYQWGTSTAEDYFCPKCGILVFRKPSALTATEISAGKVPFDGWAVNVRCIDGIDISKRPVKNVDGASL
jgi:hypothetical protein